MCNWAVVGLDVYSIFYVKDELLQTIIAMITINKLPGSIKADTVYLF